MLLSHRRLLTSLLGAALCLFLAVPASFAISPSALGSTLPDAVVIDEAEVFSRASRAELEAKLKSFSDDRVDARQTNRRACPSHPVIILAP